VKPSFNTTTFHTIKKKKRREEWTDRASVLSTFDDAQEEKRKEKRQELDEAPNRCPNPRLH
jgi:hypothetical protein